MTPSKRILSAIQPSSHLTLGNFLGAIQNWLPYQNTYECFFFIVDLHALTTRPHPQHLLDQTYFALATYLACGLDPKKTTLFIQSHVPTHSALAWILQCFTNIGELERMTQFKDKKKRLVGKSIPVGLFTYPTLMAADILLYNPHFVPVGEDQKQHLELTRDLAWRMNGFFKKDLFRLPQPLIPKTGARIMNLQNPVEKMSKSDPNPKGNIYLSDPPKTILNKFKKAVTDSGTEITDDPQKKGVYNLLEIQASIRKESISNTAQRYVGKLYGHLKQETAELVIEVLRPIQEKTTYFLKDKAQLHQILNQGAQKAAQESQKTLSKVHALLGMIS